MLRPGLIFSSVVNEDCGADDMHESPFAHEPPGTSLSGWYSAAVFIDTRFSSMLELIVGISTTNT